MKKILIIRQIEPEGPGTFGRYLRAHDIPHEVLDVYKDNGLMLSKMDLGTVGGVVILGGPMNVYEESRHPFLAAEKYFIRDLVSKNIPVLGICLGAQLIAASLGAKVRRASSAEIGWFDIRFEENAKSDPLLKDVAPETKVFQWHEDTFDLPAGATLLARNNDINQAFRYGDHVWGFQFHIEVDDQMIKEWCYEYTKGKAQEVSFRRFLSEYLAIVKEFEQKARAIYQAFLDLSC